MESAGSHPLTHLLCGQHVPELGFPGSSGPCPLTWEGQGHEGEDVPPPGKESRPALCPLPCPCPRPASKPAYALEGSGAAVRLPAASRG